MAPSPALGDPAPPEPPSNCRAFLRPLEESLNTGCLGQVSEVYDAENPQRPGGAPAQAWSVAELLRLITFDLAESTESRRDRAPARTRL